MFTLVLCYNNYTVGVNLVQSLPRTFIPEGARVEMNCTAESSQTPVWSIELPGQGISLLFLIEGNRMTLNNNGFYELQEVDVGETNIIRLLINSTVGANGTSVACVDSSDGNAILKAIL